MMKMEIANNLSSDFKDINSMLDGVDHAIVTFSVNKEGKLCKVVTFFSNGDTQFDAITAGNGRVIKDCQNFLGYRHFMYKIKGMIAKRLEYNWGTFFIKTKSDE